MSDFQYLTKQLDQLMLYEFDEQDPKELGLSPDQIHEYLARVMYARRSKMNPLWNSILVGGVKDGKRSVICLFFYSEQLLILSEIGSWPTSIC